MTGIPAEAIQAAQDCDLAHRVPVSNWHRVPDEQVARLLIGAAPVIAAAERERIRQLMHDHGSHIRPCGACRRQGWAWVPLPHLIGDPDGSTHP
jgi:hypothetical protein